VARQPNSGPGRLIVEVTRYISLSLSHTHRAGLLRTSDQLVAEAATNTTQNKHNGRTYPCTLRGSNPRSQLSSGFSLPTRRPHGHQHHKYDTATKRCSDLCCSRKGQRPSLINDAHHFHTNHLNHNDCCIFL